MLHSGRRRSVDAARAVTAAAMLALALAASAAVPAVSTAASVAVDKDKDGLVMLAGPGEQNNVSVTASAGVYTVTDSGAPISPGAGCTSLGPGVARCSAVPGGPIGFLLVSAGDGDDTVTADTPVPVYVDAGAGADIVKSGATTDFLYGNAGDDLLDAGPGADTIAGGDGRDRADYSSRVAPLVVTLDGVRGDGEAGENDYLTSSIEDVVGGAAADTLTGGTGANLLSGGGGNDTLGGGAGDDILDGGPGTDVLDGGADNDVLRSADGEADDDRCGAGQDTVYEDGSDTVAADCEARIASGPGSATPPGATLDLVPRAVRLTRRGVIRVRIYCALAAGTCRGRVSATVLRRRSRARAGVTAARRKRRRGTRFAVPAGEARQIKVTISRNGRRRVLRERRAKCRVRAVTRSGRRAARTTRTVVVRAPRKRRAR